MSTSDPKRDFAVEVVQKLQAAGFTALWAGGCVRDLLLGMHPDDYDVATSARPEQVQELFGPRRTLAIGASFGVILVHGSRRKGAGDVEVATFRTEGAYLDGRRPEHVVFATPEEDARRRDFTINGMFYDPLAEKVLDFIGGRDDLERKVVRAIGDPHARFAEDKLRMLRAVRITARFDFELEAATADAVRTMAREIPVVSQERIAQELKKMLVHPRRARAILLAHDLRLLTVILPELLPVIATAGQAGSADRWRTTLRALELLDLPRFELALAALLSEVEFEKPGPDAGDAVYEICRRLRLSNDESDDVSWLVSRRDALAGVRNLSLSQRKRFLSERLIHDLLALVRARRKAAGTNLAEVEFCEDYLRVTPADVLNPPPLLNGDDLKRAGINPGPRYKELLEIVRDAQLEGKIATKEEALFLVRQLISRFQGEQ